MRPSTCLRLRNQCGHEIKRFEMQQLFQSDIPCQAVGESSSWYAALLARPHFGTSPAHHIDLATSYAAVSLHCRCSCSIRFTVLDVAWLSAATSRVSSRVRRCWSISAAQSVQRFRLTQFHVAERRYQLRKQANDLVDGVLKNAFLLEQLGQLAAIDSLLDVAINTGGLSRAAPRHGPGGEPPLDSNRSRRYSTCRNPARPQ